MKNFQRYSKLSLRSNVPSLKLDELITNIFPIPEANNFFPQLWNHFPNLNGYNISISPLPNHCYYHERLPFSAILCKRWNYHLQIYVQPHPTQDQFFQESLQINSLKKKVYQVLKKIGKLKIGFRYSLMTSFDTSLANFKIKRNTIQIIRTILQVVIVTEILLKLIRIIIIIMPYW